jgi:hypothetical protein
MKVWKNAIVSVSVLTLGISLPLTESRAVQKENEVKLLALNKETSINKIEEQVLQGKQVKVLNSQEIIKLLKTKSPNKKHPRLMATKDDFDYIKNQIKTDENMKRWFSQLTVESDKILKEPPVKYELPDGIRLLSKSRIALKRIQSLSLMYQLTGNRIYADRAWTELKTVSDKKQFPDWNPKHFLDTAEMSAAVAIGYDWLYDYLSHDQKLILQKALMDNALRPAISIFNKTANPNKVTTWWKNSTNNWNTVSNGGITLAALAIVDETQEIEDISGEIIKNSMISIQKSLSVYGSDGSMPEGPYWNYATLYMAYFLSSLDSALGTNNGLSSIQGLKETGYFPIYMEGPGGTFNLGDSGTSLISQSPQMFWFASKYEKPEFSTFAINSYHPMNLIWYKQRERYYPNSTQFSLDKHFDDSETEVVTMRSSWDSDSLFVGIHGGNNNANHGDLDIGNFVIDALGVRWASELGSDNYDLPGYFNMSSQRWNYYRKRAEGQNTFVINPSSAPDQDINAKSKVIKFMSKANQSSVVLDMSEAYKKDAISAKRGIALENDRTTVTLRDELRLKKPSEVYWFMHTEADIELSMNNRTAILSSKGKKMYVKIISPLNGEFLVMDGNPLSTSPQTLGQNKNLGIKKLAINFKNQKNIKISISFVPEPMNMKELSSKLHSVPLDKWD